MCTQGLQRVHQVVSDDWAQRHEPWLLPLRWLPQLDLVALRVYDPAENAEVRLVDLLQHLTALLTKQFQEAVKVRHTIIDHEGGISRREVAAVSDRPGGGAIGGSAGSIDPAKRCATPLLDVYAEVGLVPGKQPGRVLGAEEDPTDAGNSCHR